MGVMESTGVMIASRLVKVKKCGPWLMRNKDLRVPVLSFRAYINCLLSNFVGISWKPWDNGSGASNVVIPHIFNCTECNFLYLHSFFHLNCICKIVFKIFVSHSNFKCLHLFSGVVFNRNWWSFPNSLLVFLVYFLFEKSFSFLLENTFLWSLTCPLCRVTSCRQLK